MTYRLGILKKDNSVQHIILVFLRRRTRDFFTPKIHCKNDNVFNKLRLWLYRPKIINNIINSY